MFSEVASRAAVAAGWRGIVLPQLRISGFAVFPVVEIDDEIAMQRLGADDHPETDMSTLAVWEGWSADLGPMPLASPVAITGFISTSPPQRALYALDVLAGYGAGLILLRGTRRPTGWTLRECELAGVSVVWSRGTDCESVVAGRRGPVATARRTVSTRQKEEMLFAHALRSGLMRSESALRG
jgi:hypothetical protein